MLEILLLVFIARTFNKYAKSHGLNNILWSVLGVVSYIVGEIIGIVIMIVVDPGSLDNILMVYVYGLPLAAICVFSMYYLMKSQGTDEPLSENGDLLDQ